MKKDGEVEERVRQLDQRIAPRDPLPAGAAAAQQDGEAQQRDVVVPADRRVAVWAMAGREDDRFFSWIAVDDDVEEGADDGAEKERQNAECRMQNGGAVSGELVLHSAVCILHSPPRPCNAQRRERVHSEAARYPEANGVWWLPRSSKPLFRRGSVE